MGVYNQLNRLAIRFPVKRTQVIVLPNTVVKLCDASNCRSYLAFTYLTATSALTFAPYPITGSGDGYPAQSTSTVFEFWIDRHFSLPQQAWFAFNTTAGSITINVIEVNYSEIENETAQGLNAGQYSGEVFPSNISC